MHSDTSVLHNGLVYHPLILVAALAMLTCSTIPAYSAIFIDPDILIVADGGVSAATGNHFVPDRQFNKEEHPSSADMILPPKSVPQNGEEVTTEKMFGKRGGYFHPFFSLRGEWTDNLYNINIDQVESSMLLTSAGLWFGLPRVEEIPIHFATHNTAIGGARLSAHGSDTFERFQTYLFGGVDYKHYSQNSDLNIFLWRLEGMYQQNLPAGISVRFIDRFSRGRDAFDRGSFLPSDFSGEDENVVVSSTPSLIRKYYSNLADLNLATDMAGKLTTFFSIANFFLDYTDEDNSWLDRSDTRYTLTLAYKYSPKTSVFSQINYAVVEYDTENEKDGTSWSGYGGINWQGSTKTSLSVKAGYQERKFDAELLAGVGTFTTGLQLDYAVTDKTRISLDLYKALEESDSLLNTGMDTFAGSFHYEQQFNYRMLGRMDLIYEKNDYEQFTSTLNNDNIADREDIVFSVRPAIEYTLRDWLICDLAFIFENRNSNLNIFDYTTQTATISLDIAF